MHRQKFGESFVRSVVLELVEGDSSKKETLVSLALLLEPNVYNMVDIDVVWKLKALSGYLGEWKFSNYDYIIKGEYFEFKNRLNIFSVLFDRSRSLI